MKNDPKRGLMCLDWNDDEPLLIYGKERNDEYQRIEIVLVPCNYIHTHLGYTGDSIAPECVADLDAQLEYLGPIDVMLYHTEEHFQYDNYGEEAIVKKSYLFNQQVNEKIPNWINTYVQRNLLSDESQFF